MTATCARPIPYAVPLETSIAVNSCKHAWLVYTMGNYFMHYSQPMPPRVKKEEISAPWACKVVPVKIEPSESKEDVTIVPERTAPWIRKDTPERNDLPERKDVPERFPEKEDVPERKPRRPKGPWKPRVPPTAPNSKHFDSKLLCAKNYAALDPARESFGLIDQGLSNPGTRALILHVLPRRNAPQILGHIKPGMMLPAISKSGRGGTTALRVRFTTPTRYFAPGSKVSSLTVGVDETDWQSLMAKAHRI